MTCRTWSTGPSEHLLSGRRRRAGGRLTRTDACPSPQSTRADSGRSIGAACLLAAREVAHIGQPQCPRYLSIRRQCRPPHRQLRGDGCGLALLHECYEVDESSCLMADRRPVIARVPATTGSMSEAPRYPPSGRSASCRSSRFAAAGRSPTGLHRTGGARWPSRAGRCGYLGAHSHECPIRSRAVIVIAQPDAKPVCGASVRRNSQRHDDLGPPHTRS